MEEEINQGEKRMIRHGYCALEGINTPHSQCEDGCWVCVSPNCSYASAKKEVVEPKRAKARTLYV